MKKDFVAEEESLQKVLDNDRVALLIEGMHYKYSHSALCSLVSVGARELPNTVGMAVRKDSPLREILSHQ